ncbi:MFS transporter [Litorihabitans aurantiacus]|uniref:MFS transporter n=1 Tax=Litorihabitans aurantiacus TaxID=1930061 RepID=A0AA38CVD1_9MICO|nr:MFS transporter [Litorihabitans aurantiacus]GMA32740.1 MFS transporter [Litorihabitans aurantiacus]
MSATPTSSTTPPAPTATTATTTAGDHRWLVLTTLALAQLMVVLDATIVNIALPSAQTALGFDDNDRQWVVTAYALAFGSLLLVGGRLSDILGRRRMFLVGLVGFAGASALGGIADSFGTLVAARALQGAFAAVLAPAALSSLTTTFTQPRERARAFGIFGAIAGMGGAIGLLLGGLLTETLSWRWNLYVNVPIAVVALVGGLVLLPRHSGRGAQRPAVLDVVLGSGGLFTLVFGFSQAEPRGWGDVLTWGPLAVGVVLLVAFALRQRHGSAPLLPLPIVTDRDRGAAFLGILVAGSGMFGAFLFVTYYLQSVLGYSPMRTGLAFMPMVLAIIVTAQLQTNLLVPRFGPKLLVPVGMLAGAAGMLSFTLLDATSTYPHLLPGFVLLGIGMGSIMPVSIQTATLGVAPAQAGAASAAVSTSQQIGGAIGTAVLNTIATTATATALAGAAAGDPAARVEAALHGFSTAYTWSAGIFAVGFVLTATLYRRRGDRAARAASAAERPATVGAADAPALAH